MPGSIVLYELQRFVQPSHIWVISCSMTALTSRGSYSRFTSPSPPRCRPDMDISANGMPLRDNCVPGPGSYIVPIVVCDKRTWVLLCTVRLSLDMSLFLQLLVQSGIFSSFASTWALQPSQLPRNSTGGSITPLYRLSPPVLPLVSAAPGSLSRAVPPCLFPPRRCRQPPQAAAPVIDAAREAPRHPTYGSVPLRAPLAALV